MGPRERRLIQRFMLASSFLVALMLAAMIWVALQSVGRGPTPKPLDPTSSNPSAGSAGP
jgi:hypothetical protein